MDIHGYEKRWAALQGLIKKSPDIDRTDKEKFLAFLKEKHRAIAVPGVVKYGLSIYQVARWLGKPLATASLDDFDDVFDKLRNGSLRTRTGKPYSPASLKDYKLSVKVFFGWLGRKEEAAQIKTTNIKKLLDPATLWAETELNKLIMAAGNVQDQALAAVLVESAGRIGEIGGMRIADAKFNVDGLQGGACIIHINGKTGPRPVMLIWSTSYLRRWLDNHPDRGKPTSHLWIYKDGRPRMYASLARTFRKAAAACGIRKPTNPHIFRKSMTTILRRKHYDPELIKRRNGWTRGSNMLEVYEAITDDDIINEERKVNGIKKVETMPTRARPCQFCGQVNGPAAMVCGSCGEVIDMAERERRLAAAMMERMLGMLPMLLKQQGITYGEAKGLDKLDKEQTKAKLLELAHRRHVF